MNTIQESAHNSINLTGIKATDIYTSHGPLSDLYSRVAKLEEMSVKQKLKIKKLKIENEELRLMIQYAPGSQCYLDAKDNFYQLASDTFTEHKKECE